MEDSTIFKWTAAVGPPKAFKRFSGHLNFPPRLSSPPLPSHHPPPTSLHSPRPLTHQPTGQQLRAAPSQMSSNTFRL